jgi:hypothetical protein
LPSVDYAARMQRQRCKACWHADGFDFHVPDWLWVAVVPPTLRDHVVCLSCFDDFASEKGISYKDHLDTVFFAGVQVAFEFRKMGG